MSAMTPSDHPLQHTCQTASSGLLLEHLIIQFEAMVTSYLFIYEEKNNFQPRTETPAVLFIPRRKGGEMNESAGKVN